MGIFNGKTVLELAEAFAEENGGIASVDELSERFDAEIAPSVIEQYGEDDTVAMSEAFNNWSDALCKDGDLHQSQYNDYCYIGDYA